jgi:hypothetical protein
VAGAVGMPLGAGMTAGNYVNRLLGLPELGVDAAEIAKKGALAFPRGLGNLASHGYVIPPAQGPVVQVPSLDDKGQAIGKADLGGQHSVHNVVNGIEQEKSEDIATLKK